MQCREECWGSRRTRREWRSTPLLTRGRGVDKPSGRGAGVVGGTGEIGESSSDIKMVGGDGGEGIRRTRGTRRTRRYRLRT